MKNTNEMNKYTFSQRQLGEHDKGTLYTIELLSNIKMDFFKNILTLNWINVI